MGRRLLGPHPKLAMTKHKKEAHIIGRDPDGHRWPMTEGWRCLYCGLRDTRQVMVSKGHEPEILLASIPSCKASKDDKKEIDRLFPMTVKDGGKPVISGFGIFRGRKI